MGHLLLEMLETGCYIHKYDLSHVKMRIVVYWWKYW